MYGGRMMLTTWGEKIDKNNVLTEYPRPQMRRDSYINLNGLWDYAFTAAGEKQPDNWDGKILVPFSPECELSGVGRARRPRRDVAVDGDQRDPGRGRPVGQGDPAAVPGGRPAGRRRAQQPRRQGAGRHAARLRRDGLGGMTLSAAERRHLTRAVDLAKQALEAGDERSGRSNSTACLADRA